MRKTGDPYVKVTVFLAAVLLTALSQRFPPLDPRIAVVTVAFALLVISYLLVGCRSEFVSR